MDIISGDFIPATEVLYLENGKTGTQSGSSAFEDGTT
jgi:hypothetical protein